MIVLDGRLYETSVVPFDVSDRGLTLADGLFETMMAIDRRIFRRVAHLDRMAAGAGALALPFDRARIEADLDLLLSALPDAEAVVRLTLTRGAGARGLALPEPTRPTVLATHAPWSADLVFRPIRLATASIRRNPTSPTARFKTLAYLDAIVALTEARERGADDALFLDGAGRPLSTTMANLFVLLGDRLITPRPEDGVLAGTTRQVVLEAARARGLSTEERPLERHELDRAQAVFVTNAVRLLCPVVAIDGVSLADNDPVARLLLDDIGARIAAECGRDPRA